MSIRDLVLAVRRHRALFAGFFVVALCAGAYSAFTAPDWYTARVEFLVSSTGTNADTSLQNNSVLQQRLPSYVPLVDSPVVLGPTIRQLGLRESPESVAQRVAAANPLGTALIDVTVRDHTARGAYDLARGIQRTFGGVVESLEATPGRASPVKVTTVRAAELPAAPDTSRPLLRLALGLLAGLALGVSAAALRDVADPTLHSGEELRNDLDLAPLATIRTAPHGPRLVVDGRSAEAEGFRRLRTTLEAIRSADGLRSVVVTATRAGDGAAAVAVNLAAVLGLAGVRVLVVGADLRSGALDDLLELGGLRGLSDVLVGDAEAADVVQFCCDGTVEVLPAGSTPPNPSELLASGAMVDLLRTLEYEYDLVLLDAPPVPAVTDAAVLANRVSGTVLVVRVGRTRPERVRRAIQALHDVHARILGAVVLADAPRRLRPARSAAPPRTRHTRPPSPPWADRTRSDATARDAPDDSYPPSNEWLDELFLRTDGRLTEQVRQDPPAPEPPTRP